MKIPKDEVLELISARSNREQTDRAEAELPEQVDTERDQALLASFAHDPRDLNPGLLRKFGL